MEDAVGCGQQDVDVIGRELGLGIGQGTLQVARGNALPELGQEAVGKVGHPALGRCPVEVAQDHEDRAADGNQEGQGQDGEGGDDPPTQAARHWC